MSTYSRVLQRIDIKDVRQKHLKKINENKLKEKQIEDEKKYVEFIENSKKILEDKKVEQEEQHIQTILNREKYDWREKLNEGMTTSDIFVKTLSATGDTNLQTIDTGSEQSFIFDFTDGINYGSDGFDLDQNYLQFSGSPDAYNDRYANTIQIDSTQYTTISFSAISGNGSNGGSTPSSDLTVYWFSDTGFGILGTIPSNASNLTKYSFTLPPEARTEKLEIFFFENNAPPQYQQYVGKNVSTIHPSTFDGFSANAANTLLTTYPTFNINNSSLTSAIFSFWATLQKTYTGSNWPNPNGYPAPISMQRGTLVGGVGGGDYKAIYDALYSKFGSGVGRYPLTYGIGNLNFQRRTPINVFVPLDTPDAASFIRVDVGPTSSSSPQERYRKVMKQLQATKEYTKKQFGSNFPGSNYVEFSGVEASPIGKQASYDSWSKAAENNAKAAASTFTYTYDVVTDTGTRKATYTGTLKPKSTSTSPTSTTSQTTTYRGGLTTGGKVTGTSPISSVPSSPPKTQPPQRLLTPKQLADIENQTKELQKQAEKNKQDAVNKQWRAVGELALGVASVAGGIGAAAKIPAAIQAAKTVSQVRQATKAYDTYKALEKIRDTAYKQKTFSPPKDYTGKPGAGPPTKGSGQTTLTKF